MRKKRSSTKERGCFVCLYIANTKSKINLNIILYSTIIPAILYGMVSLPSYYKTRVNETHVNPIELKELAPVFWVYSNKSETGYLKHVFTVLKHLGFQQGNSESDWDLLWAHDYPFRIFSHKLNKLKPYQLVNHFPGCGYITNKVDLSTSQGQYILPAFKLPEDKASLLQYATSNPEKIFVQKANDHRGIKIHNISNMNLSVTGLFVQEYIQRPFLIDGYKFDIGVYSVITSIDPLRVYAYKGDVLFRFCPVKYYPFDPMILDKYVIGDNYLPIWNIPSLRRYYLQLGFSMKDSFDAHIKLQGKSPIKVWNDIYEAIREVTLMKETQIKKIVERFGSGRNFFELVRFDFTLDENLNVYMMEANMSPNLSSAHYPANQLLYEQVIFNSFALVGIGQRIRRGSLHIRNTIEKEMQVAEKNLVVLPELCAKCENCFSIECQLCSSCFTPDIKLILMQSYLEHHNKMEYQRIFPPPINNDMVLQNYTLKNQLLIKWYQGKCELDSTWCV